MIPKRLASICVLLLFLHTSAFAQGTDSISSTPERSFWDHNGSVMYLVANGSSREFYYQKPRAGMLEAGAHPDSLLFKGLINDGHLSGTAYLFTAHCGQVPFAVKGPIPDNGEKIVLTGQVPRMGRNCQAYGEYTSTLEFKLLKTTEVAQPEQTPATAQTPGIENSKPELPSSDAVEPMPPVTESPSAGAQTPSRELPKPQVQSSAAGEPRMLGNPSAQKKPTAQAPMLEQPQIEPHEIGKPKKVGGPSVQQSLTTSAPIAAPGLMDKSILPPLIIALNVLLPFLSILFIIATLRSSEARSTTRFRRR